MSVVLHHSKASGTDKVILLGIANHEGDGGSWPAVGTLAKYAQCSERAVRYSLKRLVESGELRVIRQGGGNDGTREDRRPNLYRVLVRCPDDCVGGTAHRLRGEAGFPPNDDGVKRASERGEAGFLDGVKQASAEPSLEPSKKRKVKLSPMTDQWMPEEKNLQRLRDRYRSLDIDAQVELFRDHYLSKGIERADWDASLRTWCNRAETGFGNNKAVARIAGPFAAGSGGVYE